MTTQSTTSQAGERTQETHPLIKGDKVKVFNRTIGGREFMEGVAEIIKPTVIENRYKVRFENGETAERFCLPENIVFSVRANHRVATRALIATINRCAMRTGAYINPSACGVDGTGGIRIMHARVHRGVFEVRLVSSMAYIQVPLGAKFFDGNGTEIL